MAGRVLVIAAGGLVALLVVLWSMIGSEADAPHVSAPSQPPETSPPEAPPPAAPSARARTGAGLPALMRRPLPRPIAEPAAPANAPQLAAPTEAAPASPSLQFKRVLADQVKLTEDRLVECTEKLAPGARLSGIAALSFTLGRKDGKIVLEDTGVAYSSIEDARVIDCMRGVASAMTVDDLPEGAAAITGYRKVKLEDGKLVENWLTEYSVVPPPPAP